MQETVKELTTLMPSSGLTLVFGEESKRLGRDDLEKQISEFLEQRADWIDLSGSSAGGLHVISKAVGCNPEKILRPRYVTGFMNGLVDLIGMTKRDRPRTYVIGNIPGQIGVTSFVPLIESHISFHSTPEQGYFDFDIFSCKPFNPSRALAYTQKYFDVSGYENLQVIER